MTNSRLSALADALENHATWLDEEDWPLATPKPIREAATILRSLSVAPVAWARLFPDGSVAQATAGPRVAQGWRNEDGGIVVPLYTLPKEAEPASITPTFAGLKVKVDPTMPPDMIKLVQPEVCRQCGRTRDDHPMRHKFTP